MDILFTTMALALPILLGGLWLGLFVPVQSTARTALVWGNGTLIGLLLLPQFMRTLDALGLGLSFAVTGSLAGALIVLALIAHVFRGKKIPEARTTVSDFSALPASHKALITFLLALLFLRVTTLGLEILWRPLFPWDATMHWATKARVWFEFNSMAPFVAIEDWLNLGGEGVFTDRHANYPPTLPLLQVWMNQATGRWDESLMNLPWLLCLIALGTAFYAQLRVAHVGQTLAMVFTYFLLSMPLINIHVALAGYADLFLSAAYCCALMAFHNWVSTRQRWQAGLAIFFVLACPMIKNEGFIWSSTLLPALVIALATRREAFRIIVLFLLAAIVLVILAQLNPDLIDQATVHLTDFHADGLIGILKTIWLHDNWHLFGYLLLAILPLSLMLPGAIIETYRGIIVALTSAVGLFLFLFLFTVFGDGASMFTGVGRLTMQFAPGWLFLIAMLCNDFFTRTGMGPLPGKGAAISQR